MKDMFGTEVERGDIIALGVRSGNTGSLVLRVILDPETRKVKGFNGGVGKLGDFNDHFVKLQANQLDNYLGGQMLEFARQELENA